MNGGKGKVREWGKGKGNGNRGRDGTGADGHGNGKGKEAGKDMPSGKEGRGSATA